MEEKMTIKTQNQERAKFVLENLNILGDSNYAQKISSYIVANGLMPTLAFLQDKDKNNTYAFLKKYLEYKKYININEDPIEKLANSDSTRLRIITTEIMEIANWVRRLI
jgi:CRISPR type III-B/RAMP module-associated protein Cmr5